jgi:hypothetical protein
MRPEQWQSPKPVAPIKRVLAVSLLCVGTALGAGLEPYGLECEARRDPLGVDLERPRLGWKLKSAERDQRQTAYQILVAGSPEKLAAGAGDRWDSGRVDSGQTTWIPYAGAPLQAFNRYWWKVRAWDAAGQASPWSEPAEWTMAALDPGAFRAGWIAHPNQSLRSGPLPIFRKEIVVNRPLRRALAVVSGVGFHELRINGAKAGDHVLSPAWTNYRATVLYEMLDVTALMKTGANAVGVLLGNGFYNVAGGRYAKYTGSFGHPRLFVQLHLEFEDGAVTEVGTDGSWRVHDGPLTFSCIYGGEDFDARLEPAGWDRPGFDDSSCPRAVQPARPRAADVPAGPGDATQAGNLCLRSGPELRRLAEDRGEWAGGLAGAPDARRTTRFRGPGDPALLRWTYLLHVHPERIGRRDVVAPIFVHRLPLRPGGRRGAGT